MTREAELKREARQRVMQKLLAAGHPRHVAKQLADKAVTKAMARVG